MGSSDHAGFLWLGPICLEKEFRGCCEEGQASAIISGCLIRPGTQILSGNDLLIETRMEFPMGRKKTSGPRQNAAQEDMQILGWVGADVGPGSYLQAGQHTSPVCLQGLRRPWPALDELCHLLLRLGGEGDLRCPMRSSHPASGCSPL